MIFDPAFPPTSNSLNRFKIWELTGFPPEKIGWAFYDLVSSAALTRAIEAHAEVLAIAPTEDNLHMTYFQRLADSNEAAVAIARQMGRCFGFLLVALKRGNTLNREKNAEKDAAYWAYWSQVDTVYLGGGLADGDFGRLLLTAAQQVLEDYGIAIQLHIAIHPRHLGILGAARYVSTGQQAIALDFGGTLVKRARAAYTASGLQHVELLPSLPVEFDLYTGEGQEQAIFDTFVSLLVDAYQLDDAPVIPVSISAYTSPDGQPLMAQGGIYMHMSRLSNNLPKLLSQTVSQRVGRDVTVKLLHDGSAAAAFFAPLDHAVVITLGTAIGSGYPVARSGLRPVAPDLSVQASDSPTHSLGTV